MNLSQRREHNALVVGLSGRLDVTTVTNVEPKLLGLIEPDEKLLIVDCDQLDYISSAGLRVLLMAAKKMRAQQGDMRLSALQAPVREVFEIAGFNQIFPIFPDIDSALKATA